MELVLYNAAKAALAKCANLDEVCGWADKAAALAAYGRQVNDETLEADAQRIRARAYQRMGQLLKEVPPGKTGPKKFLDPGVNLVSPLSRSPARSTLRSRHHGRKQRTRPASARSAKRPRCKLTSQTMSSRLRSRQTSRRPSRSWPPKGESESRGNKIKSPKSKSS